LQHLRFLPTPTLKPLPNGTPVFGTVATDHMLEVDFRGGMWQTPKIRPLEELRVHPMSKVFHYCPTVIEGLKAFRGVDGRIRLFRPEMSAARLLASTRRAALPDFCPVQLEHMIARLISEEKAWIPKGDDTALYIRPFIMGTDANLGVGALHEAKLVVVCSPVGAYYADGWKAVKLHADPSFTRATPGGVGAYKMGCNYAPTLKLIKEAASFGCHQSLWLYGEEQLITEAGTSNLFLYWRNKKDELELITPPVTDGLILPGVTRDSILTLAKEWSEFKVTERYPTMAELREAAKEKRIIEFFGSGTAAVVFPCERIVYSDKNGSEPINIDIPQQTDGIPLYKRIYDTITGIQYGKIDRPEWVRIVD
ncbi:hypothetical protein PFISCL1PPCAC_18590, partial [Pristionchus fissidentatus]